MEKTLLVTLSSDEIFFQEISGIKERALVAEKDHVSAEQRKKVDMEKERLSELLWADFKTLSTSMFGVEADRLFEGKTSNELFMRKANEKILRYAKKWRPIGYAVSFIFGAVFLSSVACPFLLADMGGIALIGGGVASAVVFGSATFISFLMNCSHFFLQHRNQWKKLTGEDWFPAPSVTEWRALSKGEPEYERPR